MQKAQPVPTVSSLYEDESIGVVMKSPRLLVHRSEVAPREERFALQLARDLFDRRVYAAHRLDRGTSGVLVFAFDPQTAAVMERAWAAGAVRKRYALLVRGWLDGATVIDHPLKPVEDAYLRVQKTEPQTAVTTVTAWGRRVIPVPFGGFDSIRVSLAACEPLTGRRHQIRRHMKHAAHPIFGDATYGKGPLNRTAAAWWGTDRLMLHCARMAFPHPVSGVTVDVTAAPDAEFARALAALDLTDAYNTGVCAPWEPRPLAITTMEGTNE